MALGTGRKNHRLAGRRGWHAPESAKGVPNRARLGPAANAARELPRDFAPCSPFMLRLSSPHATHRPRHRGTDMKLRFLLAAAPLLVAALILHTGGVLSGESPQAAGRVRELGGHKGLVRAVAF